MQLELLSSSTLKARLREIKSFFLSFMLGSILCALFGAFWIYAPDILLPLAQWVVRVDILEYLVCVAPVLIAGFLHGYRNAPQTRKERWDYALFYLQLYFVCAYMMGVCVWDNIIILYRAWGPEHLDLSARMEIQFIFVYFLDIGTYRFFTLIYFLVGLYCIIHVRKRSNYVLALLFMFYIFSSLVLGYVFGYPISSTNFFSPEITFYILAAIIIGMIMGMIFALVKKWWYKDFSSPK